MFIKEMSSVTHIKRDTEGLWIGKDQELGFGNSIHLGDQGHCWATSMGRRRVKLSMEGGTHLLLCQMVWPWPNGWNGDNVNF